MKIKSLRLALKGGNPECPTGAGSSVNLIYGLNPHQDPTTSAGDAPPVSPTPERRASGMKISFVVSLPARFGLLGLFGCVGVGVRQAEAVD